MKNILKKIQNKYANKEENEKENNLNIILEEAEKKESQSNQILEFTKEIKNSEKKFRFKILEVLWKIIYSVGILNINESTLMKRSNGLFYLYRKENRDIKHQLLKIKQYDIYN